MKVILKRDVKGLGREGDLKEVKDGYARNHLLPTGAAVLADKGAVANWERHRDQREERDRSARADAEATAREAPRAQARDPGQGRRARTPLRRGDRRTRSPIAISREGIELDRHALHLREPIKALGEYRIDVRVMPGVEAVGRRQRGGRRVLSVETREAARLLGGRVEATAGRRSTRSRSWPATPRRPSTSTEPFREPSRSADGVRAYVERVLGEEEDPRVWIGEPIVDGDRAAIPWWASLREDGADATLAGTSVLRFDADGLVIEQWDAWNQLGERREPHRASPFSERDT